MLSCLRLRFFALFLAVLTSASVQAQTTPTAAKATTTHAAAATPVAAPVITMPNASKAGAIAEDAALVLQDQRADLAAIQARQEHALDSATLNDLRQQAMQVYVSVNEQIQGLSAQISEWQSRLTELGPVPQDAAEDPQAAEQRSYLTAVLSQADAQNRLANLLLRDTEQTLGEISNQRRDLFQRQLFERTPSILTGRFWSNFQNNLNLDASRGKALGEQMHEHLLTVPTWLWICMVFWTALTWLCLRSLSVRLRALSARKAPAGRLRQSLYAWQKIILFTAAPFAWLGGIYCAFSWFAPLPEVMRHSLGEIVGVAAFCFYLAGLGHALLAANTPIWRILPMRDATAIALRHLPGALSFMLMLGWLSEHANQLVNTRLGLSVLSDSLFCLIVTLILAVGLLRLRRIRKRTPEAPVTSLHQSSWVGRLLKNNANIVDFALWCILVVVSIGWLLGYVAFSKFVLQQLVWSFTVVGTAYLLSVTISDVAAWLTAEPEPEGDADEAGVDVGSSLAPRALKKWIILAAGLAQASVALLSVVLLFASFATESFGINSHIQFLSGELKWGGIEIQPLTIVQALMLFLIGSWLISIVKEWLAQRFFPATGLDKGVQASLSTLASYAAYVVVFSMALSVTGIGFERVTWIASALSVGIGFGLQAIVQNFVSGLILLAERPVKVGDWVSLSGIEGDIRRINVRATEIQMSDRSTVIVPNSEFVTKMVRNITYADSLGRLQIKLAMPLNAPPTEVKAIIEQTMRDNPSVMTVPPPAVYMDDVNSSSMIFNAVAFVASPRLAYSTRSAVLFTILERLKTANISTISPVGPTLQPTTPTP